jgi:hypothetical protein
MNIIEALQCEYVDIKRPHWGAHRVLSRRGGNLFYTYKGMLGHPPVGENFVPSLEDLLATDWTAVT